MSSRTEKLRNLFLFVFFLLVISIIFTPLLVQRGFSIFPEESLESVLLFFQVFIGWRIFLLYQRGVESREREIQKLEGEYQKREKELLAAFAYLGKVNVQISLIQSFLQKIKAPSSRKEAESYINEILSIALTLSGKKWATLRAIDAKSLQTVKEYWAKNSPEVDTGGIKIGNKDIASWEEEGNQCKKNGYCVYTSAGSKLSPFKVFLVFLNGEKMDQDIEGFLRAAANQCEVLLTMFDSKEKR
ncbi:MAG: hypothetical protein NT170_02520 [Candidatus Moranbacteria bacterium]|nr:hypothetical protein [Candidatus Moranbacteria bacterium]